MECAKAEALCDQIAALGIPKRIVDRTRYGIYTMEGRTTDAYRALKSVVTDTPRSVSSDASDPVMLTRFGMMAKKVGRLQEAESAFLKATENKMCYLGRGFYPSISQGSTYQKIESAALFCAGIELSFQAHYSDASEYLRKSISLDSQNWKPHYGLAYALHLAGRRVTPRETIAEAKKALRLVPPESEQMLRHNMKVAGISDGREFRTIGWTDQHGKPHVKVVEIQH